MLSIFLRFFCLRSNPNLEVVIEFVTITRLYVNGPGVRSEELSLEDQIRGTKMKENWSSLKEPRYKEQSNWRLCLNFLDCCHSSRHGVARKAVVLSSSRRFWQLFSDVFWQVKVYTRFWAIIYGYMQRIKTCTWRVTQSKRKKIKPQTLLEELQKWANFGSLNPNYSFSLSFLVQLFDTTKL